MGAVCVAKRPHALVSTLAYHSSHSMFFFVRATSLPFLHYPFFSAADAPCPLDLLIVAGLPSKNSQVWDDGTQSLGLTPADFEEVKKYLRARVDTFLTKHPGYYIGILQYANAQQIACPMSNDKQALFACIDGNPYDNDIANGNTLTLQTVNGQPSAEIGTLPAMLLATEHLKAFFKKRRLSEDRQVYEYAVERMCRALVEYRSPTCSAHPVKGANMVTQNPIHM